MTDWISEIPVFTSFTSITVTTLWTISTFHFSCVTVEALETGGRFGARTRKTIIRRIIFFGGVAQSRVSVVAVDATIATGACCMVKAFTGPGVLVARVGVTVTVALYTRNVRGSVDFLPGVAFCAALGVLTGIEKDNLEKKS